MELEYTYNLFIDIFIAYKAFFLHIIELGNEIGIFMFYSVMTLILIIIYHEFNGDFATIPIGILLFSSVISLIIFPLQAINGLWNNDYYHMTVFYGCIFLYLALGIILNLLIHKKVTTF